ncbi:hypothetical protein BE08_29130, partial [Sorangium cellulosum]
MARRHGATRVVVRLLDDHAPRRPDPHREASAVVIELVHRAFRHLDADELAKEIVSVPHRPAARQRPRGDVPVSVVVEGLDGAVGRNEGDHPPALVVLVPCLRPERVGALEHLPVIADDEGIPSARGIAHLDDGAVLAALQAERAAHGVREGGEPAPLVVGAPLGPVRRGGADDLADSVVRQVLLLACRILVSLHEAERVPLVTEPVPEAVDDGGLVRPGPVLEAHVEEAPGPRRHRRFRRADLLEDVGALEVAPGLDTAPLPRDLGVHEMIPQAAWLLLLDEVVLVVVRVPRLRAAGVDGADEVSLRVELVRHDALRVLHPVRAGHGDPPALVLPLLDEPRAAPDRIQDLDDLALIPRDLREIAGPIAQLREPEGARRVPAPEDAEDAVVEVDDERVFLPVHAPSEGEQHLDVAGWDGERRLAERLVDEGEPVAPDLGLPAQGVGPAAADAALPQDRGGPVRADPADRQRSGEEEIGLRRREHRAGDDVDGVPRVGLTVGPWRRGRA